MKKCAVSIIVCLVFVFNSFIVFSGPADFNNEEVLRISNITKMEELKALAAVLIDVDSGRVLFEKNKDQQLPFASVTKIMTSLLIIEALDSGKIKLDTMIPVSPDAEAMGGSQVFLKVGESFSVDEMLKAIFVHSANDACVAVADFIAGSEGVFVEKMNAKAKELGMTNTKFADCTGLTDDGHFSSAMDISIMSKELLTKHPKSVEYSTIWKDTFRGGKFDLDNTNKMVKYYNGTTGLKTGFTTKAGYCLAVSAKREQMHIVAVILGEPDNNTRFGEARRLLDYGFANYKLSQILKKDQIIGQTEVGRGVKLNVETCAKEDFSTLVKNGEESAITTESIYDAPLKAPVVKDTKAGILVIKLNGQKIGQVDLITTKAVEEASFFRLIFRKIASWFGIRY